MILSWIPISETEKDRNNRASIKGLHLKVAIAQVFYHINIQYFCKFKKKKFVYQLKHLQVPAV